VRYVACCMACSFEAVTGKESIYLMTVNDTYRVDVTFRIFGPNLDPDKVSALLIGIAPTHSHRQGEERKSPIHSKRKPLPYNHGMWSVSSSLSADQPLEVHLEHLLTLLEPNGASIKDLSSHVTVDFYCGLWGKSGFDLPANIMTRMGNLGAGFAISVYGS
jgi:Domain of unknown function (DUF4279)